MNRSVGVAALAMMMAAAAPACAEGDASAGKVVFKKCQACHSLKADETLIGPSLHGIFGRKAGAIPDFRYSTSMRNSGIMWDDDTLGKYLPDPQALVPHTKMTFIGLKDLTELADLIAYLRQATR
jgi:cytochrome c2